MLARRVSRRISFGSCRRLVSAWRADRTGACLVSARRTRTERSGSARKEQGPDFIALGAVVAAGAIVAAFFAMKAGPTDKPVASAETSVTGGASTAASCDANCGGRPDDYGGCSGRSRCGSGECFCCRQEGRSGGWQGGGRREPWQDFCEHGSAATGKTAEPAKPKTGNCGCAAGDLMCAMQCSAKGH